MFTLADVKFKFVTDVFTLADVWFKFVTEIFTLAVFKFMFESCTSTLPLQVANVEYPCTPVKSICADSVTTLSPPALNNLDSPPAAPAFQ